MITKKVIFHFFLPVIIIIFMITCASGESELDVLLNGNIKDPVTVRITSPAFLQLSQFSSERTENLNKILNHFSINIRLDGSISETTVSSDQTPLFSVKEFNTDEKDPIIFADRGEIKRVIINLCGNAVNYTNKGGEIKILVQTRENDLIFSIADNGNGIKINGFILIPILLSQLQSFTTGRLQSLC